MKWFSHQGVLTISAISGTSVKTLYSGKHISKVRWVNLIQAYAHAEDCSWFSTCILSGKLGSILSKHNIKHTSKSGSVRLYTTLCIQSDIKESAHTHEKHGEMTNELTEKWHKQLFLNKGNFWRFIVQLRWGPSSDDFINNSNSMAAGQEGVPQVCVDEVMLCW